MLLYIYYIKQIPKNRRDLEMKQKKKQRGGRKNRDWMRDLFAKDFEETPPEGITYRFTPEEVKKCVQHNPHDLYSHRKSPKA